MLVWRQFYAQLAGHVDWQAKSALERGGRRRFQTRRPKYPGRYRLRLQPSHQKRKKVGVRKGCFGIKFLFSGIQYLAVPAKMITVLQLCCISTTLQFGRRSTRQLTLRIECHYKAPQYIQQQMPRPVTKRPHPLLHCRWLRPSQRHSYHQPLEPQPYKQIQPDRLLHQPEQVMPVRMQKIGQQGVGRPTPLASHPLYFNGIFLLSRLGCTLVSPPSDQRSLGPTLGTAFRHGYRPSRTNLCCRVFFDCLCKLDYDQCPIGGTPPPAAELSTLCAVRGGVPSFFSVGFPLSVFLSSRQACPEQSRRITI